VQGGFSNLAFLLRWMHEMRVAILEGRFEAWRLDAQSAYTGVSFAVGGSVRRSEWYH